MAVEALVRTLRPPDRYPPRLATLSADQEEVVVSFLEAIALGDDHEGLREDAQLALEEWWLPGARHRITLEQVAALRAAPVTYQEVERPLYRLTLPAAFGSDGPHQIPEEFRTVEVWGGVLCGDAPAVVAVNITPVERRTASEVLDRAATGLRAEDLQRGAFGPPGAVNAERRDGWTRGDSPAEPQRVTLIAATVGPSVVLLTLRFWPRPDVEATAERIVESFEVVGSPS